MTANDVLRRMLDERGVEWGDDGYPTTCTVWASDGIVWHGLWRDDCIELIAHLTPEQAIAATLGRRECKIHDCEGSFSAVNRPVWRCDCGAFMTQYTDATTYHKPRFCPNCGRRVVGE